jgi:[histone H3]-lysine4 N-trimethyltransferase SETD1
MSRPLGNKFADFFPSAPSVLQQRKSSKQSEDFKERSHRADAHSHDALTKDSNVKSPSSTHKSAAPRFSDVQMSGTSTTSTQITGEDSDHFGNDLLNGVGSASSTSTASSIFSAAFAHGSGITSNSINVSVLTPLTNSDLSPRGKLMSPPNDLSSRSTMDFQSSSNTLSGAMTPQRTPTAARKLAREPDLKVKGMKCIYDPELDKSLSSKDKRKLKAQFEEIGTKSEHNTIPADPRVALPNYTKGGCGKAKAKFRPAPYNLRPWPVDPATTITPPAATMVVVTGFDPMAPLIQISALFSSYGEIADLDNKTDPVTGRFLGICSIGYKDCPSFQGGGPISAILAAKTAFQEGKRGQRIGLKTIRVDMDRDGTITEKLVEKAIAVQRRESGFTNSSKVQPSPSPLTPVASQIAGFAKTTGPPPTAPKGPSGRPSIRPPVVAPHSSFLPTIKPVRELGVPTEDQSSKPYTLRRSDSGSSTPSRRRFSACLEGSRYS